MNGIAGKVVAVTGASSGIGEATAVLLAERGAAVVLGARRRDRLDALVGRIEDAGGRAVAATVDVTRRDDVAGLVELARTTYGRLDVLVNNAGTASLGRMADGDVDAWDAMIDVNLRGVLHGIAAAMPVFEQQGSGHLVTTVSTSGIRIVPTQGVYAGTKNAVRTILEALRQECTDGTIRVNWVSPGYVSTELTGADAVDWALPPDAIARAIAFAIEQPDGVDVGEIVVRPARQG